MGYQLGYWMARPQSAQDAKKYIKSLSRKTKRRLTGEEIGVVDRLSPQQQEVVNNPTLREEEEEMERVLDEVIGK